MSPADHTDATTLRGNALGTWGLVFFVVAAAAPLAIMSGVAPLAIQFGGLGAPGGYLLGGVVMLVFAVGFTAMTRHISQPGGFYAYITAGMGRTAGVGSAFVALVSYITIAVGFVPAVGVFAHETADSVFGVDIAWGYWAVLCWIIVAVLGYLNVAVSAKVLGTILILEVLILLVFAVPVLARGGAEGLSFDSFSPKEVFSPGVGGLLVLAFGAFIGFESTALYRGETRDGARAVPRATYIAVGFLAIFYSLVVWAVIMAFGPAGAIDVATENPVDMFFVATTEWIGQPASDAMHVLLVTSALASVLAVHNSSARYIQTLARGGTLPRRLSYVNPSTNSPSRASVVITVTTAVIILGFELFGADPYSQTFLWLNGIGIVGIIGLQVICSVAVILFFRTNHRGVGIAQRLVAPVIAATALATALYLMVKNFSILTAASTTINMVLLAIVPSTFLIGVAVASLTKRAPSVDSMKDRKD